MQKDTVQNIVCNVDPEVVARIWEERDRVGQRRLRRGYSLGIIL